MKRVMMTMIVATVLAFSVAAGWATEPPMMEKPLAGKTQVACPVRGGNVDKNLYADYKGQRIYFCCKGCDEEFKKNPEKYLEKMKSQGVTPEKCPTGPAKSGQ